MYNQERPRICSGGELVGEMQDLQSIAWNVDFDFELGEVGVDASLIYARR